MLTIIHNNRYLKLTHNQSLNLELIINKDDKEHKYIHLGDHLYYFATFKKQDKYGPILQVNSEEYNYLLSLIQENNILEKF